jgi:hypothetical protein
MERYIRSIFNFTFIIPLVLSWGLLIKSKYFKNLNFKISSFEQSKVRKSAGEDFPSLQSMTQAEEEIPKEDKFAIQLTQNQNHMKQIMQFEKEKHELSSEQVTQLNQTAQQDQTAQTVQNLQPANSNLKDTSKSNEPEPAASVEVAPDYDETLVEVVENSINRNPLKSKYINTVCS